MPVMTTPGWSVGRHARHYNTGRERSRDRAVAARASLRVARRDRCSSSRSPIFSSRIWLRSANPQPGGDARAGDYVERRAVHASSRSTTASLRASACARGSRASCLQPLERSFYVWIASLLFIAVCALWRPVPGVAWQVDGPCVLGDCVAVQVAGVWLTLRSAADPRHPGAGRRPAGPQAIAARPRRHGVQDHRPVRLGAPSDLHRLVPDGLRRVAR